MKFSFHWIRELSGTVRTAQEVAELLNARSFEVKDVAEGPQDTVLDIDILPNRPDALSHLNVAREVCALEGRVFAPPQIEYSPASHASISVTIENANACLRYGTLAVRGVTVGPSPGWIVQRLEACGLASINNVVDATNYTMLLLGQPMHAFDMASLDALVVRNARAGEELTALDEANTVYQLEPSMLVIADSKKPVAIAGIKGGVGSAISASTRDVVLEAACFDPTSVRATSRMLGLRTDASVRFGYGVDPALAPAALVYCATLLVEAAGGTPDGGVYDIYPSPKPPTTIMFDPAFARSLLGVQLSSEAMEQSLVHLGFDVSRQGDRFAVDVPSRRLDVTSQEDLIEEVIRMQGYDSVLSQAPLVLAFGGLTRKEEAQVTSWDDESRVMARSRITHLLAGAGYTEVYNYAFMSDDMVRILRLHPEHELALPQSAEYRWLRSSLVPRILSNVRDNMRYFESVHLFEVGHVFGRLGDEMEDSRLALVCASTKESDEVFYELKGAVESLLERLGIADAWFDDADPLEADEAMVQATTQGRRATIRTEAGGALGALGIVSTRVATELKLRGSTAVCEIDLRALIEYAQRTRQYEALPRFPSVVRDIAMRVRAEVKIDTIVQEIQRAGGELVVEVDVFDIFVPTGNEKLASEGATPEYGKSVALHVTFRSPERTLTDVEVTEIEQRIKQSLEEVVGAEIR